MKKKIKLKDMTTEQWDNYVNRCKLTCDKCVFEIANCRLSECKGSWLNNKDMYSDKFLDQEVEIEVPDILTKEEKEYLSFIIKPFRDRVTGIQKVVGSGNVGYISINVDSISSLRMSENIDLPIFPTDTMYENMRENHLYNLKELGL